MTKLSRLTLLAASAALALLLSRLFYAPVLVWEAPQIYAAAVAVTGWLLWFLVLSPVWLPSLVPTSMTNLARAMHLICGVLLILPMALWVALVMQGDKPETFAVATLFAGGIGTWHLAAGFGRWPLVSSGIRGR